MFCFQCQESAKNTGCTVKGVCGKSEDTANYQDLLIYALRGIAVYDEKASQLGISNRENGLFVAQALFATITNANFDNDRIIELIKEALSRKKTLKEKFLAAYKEKKGRDFDEPLHHSAVWFSDDVAEFDQKAKSVGVLATENEDVRSLRELLIIGLKGIAAYADHAAVLGFEKEDIYDFLTEALASTTKDLSVDDMIALVMKAG
ncbi:MAG: hydroxylamine reductase, partial [Deltaproteobacteria bacterium]|nr:hydroxylamine reductase [Deltaproteobacteria bacterium]